MPGNSAVRGYVSGLVAAALLGLCGCGGGGGGEGPPQIIAQILSDPTNDGDIELTSAGDYIVTQGMSPSVQSVLAGIDPATGSEFRALLDFPLTGGGGVPGDARIDSAFLEVFVDDVEPAGGRLPVRVELVAFQPPTLIATDFDRDAQPPLASALVQGDVTRTDIGNFVPVDVTPLMIAAQQLGLVDFQVRVMEDLGPAILTLVAIGDSTGPDRRARAPLLTVTYH